MKTALIAALIAALTAIAASTALAMDSGPSAGDYHAYFFGELAGVDEDVTISNGEKIAVKQNARMRCERRSRAAGYKQPSGSHQLRCTQVRAL